MTETYGMRRSSHDPTIFLCCEHLEPARAYLKPTGEISTERKCAACQARSATAFLRTLKGVEES